MQATSLLPLLTGATGVDHLHDDVYCEYYNGMRARTEPAPFATMLRDPRYKWMRTCIDRAPGGRLSARAGSLTYVILVTFGRACTAYASWEA